MLASDIVDSCDGDQRVFGEKRWHSAQLCSGRMKNSDTEASFYMLQHRSLGVRLCHMCDMARATCSSAVRLRLLFLFPFSPKTFVLAPRQLVRLQCPDQLNVHRISWSPGLPPKPTKVGWLVLVTWPNQDVRKTPVSHQAESGQYITLYFQQLWPPNNSSHLVMLESLMSIHPVALTVILSLEWIIKQFDITPKLRN